MESRCRHIMGDMERKAKMLWDALGLVGRLSERVSPICRLYCQLSSKVVSNAGGRGWEMHHRKRETESCGKSGSR